jgi:hypothetical protein
MRIFQNAGKGGLAFPQRSVEKMWIIFRRKSITLQNLIVFSDLPIFVSIK